MTDNLPELPASFIRSVHSLIDAAYRETGTEDPFYVVLNEARSAIASERARADALRTVMIAAAEEIAAHWEAHCDSKGYGPQNLLRRLEEGIPSEYGYTAGAFAELKSRADALEAALRKSTSLLNDWVNDFVDCLEGGESCELVVFTREAINAANSLLEKTNDR